MLKFITISFSARPLQPYFKIVPRRKPHPSHLETASEEKQWLMKLLNASQRLRPAETTIVNPSCLFPQYDMRA